MLGKGDPRRGTQARGARFRDLCADQKREPSLRRGLCQDARFWDGDVGRPPQVEFAHQEGDPDYPSHATKTGTPSFWAQGLMATVLIRGQARNKKIQEHTCEYRSRCIAKNGLPPRPGALGKSEFHRQAGNL